MMVPSMTPQEWASRTQQQWEHVARYRGPPPPGFAATPASLVAVSDPRTNGAAIVSLAVGVLAFLPLFLPMRLPGLVLVLRLSCPGSLAGRSR